MSKERIWEHEAHIAKQKVYRLLQKARKSQLRWTGNTTATRICVNGLITMDYDDFKHFLKKCNNGCMTIGGISYISLSQISDIFTW